MALIEYRIKVVGQTATVTQHVLEIGPGDRIQFSRDDSEAQFVGATLEETVIRIEGNSPCRDLRINENLKIPKVGDDAVPHDVTRSNKDEDPRPRDRNNPSIQHRFFVIRCGREVAPSGFKQWDGQGPDPPDPGTKG